MSEGARTNAGPGVTTRHCCRRPSLVQENQPAAEALLRAPPRFPPLSDIGAILFTGVHGFFEADSLGGEEARRRAPACPVPARIHFALRRIWLCARMTSRPVRSTIGFDRLFDLAETAQRAGEDNYPPYNIERLPDDRYQISLAVAGFSPTKSRLRPS
jgi:hypothetical protein